jgi:DNA-binding IclR family transcriptional regulator
MPTDNTDSPRILTTITNGVEILNALIELGSAGVTELAQYQEISKSTAHSYLKTLEYGGLVSQNEAEEYQLSANFLVYGEYVRNRSQLYQVGKSTIDELAETTGQYAHLVIEEDGRGINLYKSKGEEAVGDEYQAAKFQQRDYLHITASGKAILAHLPEDRIDEIIDRYGLPARTENTITDRDELFDELEGIREQGYALNDEEEIEGFRAVGAPITHRNGRILGSASISGPTSIFKDNRFYEEIPEEVTKTANLIEVDINMASRSTEITREK